MHLTFFKENAYYDHEVATTLFEHGLFALRLKS
jgi:hypothetical protein